MARCMAAAVCSVFLAVSAFASHSPLLPVPQKVEYRTGSVLVRDLSIHIASTPVSKDDEFSATELQRTLFDRSGIQVSIARVVSNSDINAGVPITLDRTGPVDPLPVPGEKPGSESREAYELEVTRSSVTIRARSSAGIFYGVQTLVQLVEGEGANAQLPAVLIHDWPALAYRGTMVDMSEGQLATEQEVKRQIAALARWKANQYYFYNEDSVELDGFPLLNAGARFSKTEVKSIIAYARERHIDVVPCLELYGHQHDLFRIEKYSDLADFPHGGELDPANPHVRALLADWVDQYAALFPSPFVHIGFDETWEIARAAKKGGAQSTPTKLFLDQLNIVANRFQNHGKTVMAWADIMVRYPDIITSLPQGLIAVPWYYEPQPDPNYKRWLDPLVAHKVPTFVAAGVHMFTEIAPDFVKTFDNIDTFLAAGKRSQTLGLINTLWSDDQMALRRAGWPGMAYGAIAAWQENPVDQSNFFSHYASVVYPANSAEDVAIALQQLSQAEISLQKVWGSETMIAVWRKPFEAGFWENLKLHQDELRQTRLLAEDAEKHFLSALASGADATTLESLLFAAQMLDYAGMKGLYVMEIGQLWERQKAINGTDEELWDRIDGAFSQMHGRVGDLMDSLSELGPEYQKNWLEEYTSYRLTRAMIHFELETEYWRNLQVSYRQFRDKYQTGQPLPTLSDFNSMD
jgi:hexosaminidase